MTDADEAGDVAANGLTVALTSFGALVERRRPVGRKDVNEMLMWNLDVLRRLIGGTIYPEAPSYGYPSIDDEFTWRNHAFVEI